MKYIIEIEEEPFGRNDDPVIPHGMDELYRAKGFNALVFDKHGLDKLTPLNKELEEAYQKGYNEAKLIYQNPNAESDYQRGLDDAWGCARKLFSEMSDTEINLVFPQEWNNGGFNALMALKPKDAIDRINAFERKQESDEIKVGDEVQNCREPNACFVIVSIDILNEEISGFDQNGHTYSCRPKDAWHKTGRHFDIESILEEMKA